MTDETDADAVPGHMLREIHRLAPEDLPTLLRSRCAAMGFSDITVYLADMQQRVLVELTEPTEAHAPAHLPIDSSLAGWAYRTSSPRITRDDAGQLTVWMPMLDGVERFGAMAFQTARLDAAMLDRCHSVASLATLLVLDKAAYSDVFGRLQRTRPMRMPAEMVWAHLPPRTVGNDLVTSSAVLEPAYDLGGDAFDHSLNHGVLHATILDAMGHDLAAGITSAVGLAALRHARHQGADLAEMAVGIDTTLQGLFPDRYLTGVFTRLDTTTGHLSWINAGHPTPLLLRQAHRVPQALQRSADLPLGTGLTAGPRWQVHHAQLEPGDQILLYTDGVPEARNAAGEQFGEDRFTDFVNRALAAGEAAPEALRRLVHAILAYQQTPLHDDATLLLFEWHPFANTATRNALS
ncbi:MULTISPECIES: PP2C family protein-serine/threonine phosphatase [Streptomyces]|uniref:PP2C family protein-serine/threonine phosphatase n=1 Tax=Streptomyces TaxID=1883 RepID=UPI0022498797|nr:PP2C family protein-serine/threonine phosphatase [Streptomyces sp. JHD 1]MCX2970216.1 PP2C family protein-serine/threonine phosphatase [Streptomyces sp. JHD 1]